MFNGRYCIANAATVEGSGLEAACHMATSAADFKTTITALYDKPFCLKEITLRHRLLDNMFDNEVTAKRMIAHIWP